jgi:hypothetical protein
MHIGEMLHCTLRVSRSCLLVGYGLRTLVCGELIGP